MSPHQQEALARLRSISARHRGGHTCDGVWYNPNAGQRLHCPTSLDVAAAEQQVTALSEAVHNAAHDTAAAVHVAEAMTGLTLAELDPEDREGWTAAARMALEGLAEWLDRDPALEARHAAVLERLNGVRA